MTESLCDTCGRKIYCGVYGKTYCTGYLKVTPVKWEDTSPTGVSWKTWYPPQSIGTKIYDTWGDDNDTTEICRL